MSGIRLKEVMEIYPFSRATLMAGGHSLDVMVNSANIQEVPNVDQWLHGGEILFTSGYAFQTAENGIKLLWALREKGAAAIAIKTGFYLPEIPKEMIQYAEQIGFPVFLLPEDLPYMDCIIPIFEAVTQSQISMMRRNELIHNQLVQVIVQGKGLDGICQVLSQAVTKPVAVVNLKGQILAMEVLGKAKCTGGPDMGNLISRIFTDTPNRRLRKNKCNTMVTPEGESLVCIPVFVKEEQIAYLVLNIKESDMSSMDLLAFENASTLVAVELLKEQEVLHQERKVREQLLDDLIAKRYSDEDIMVRRGRYVGLDLKKDCCVMILGVGAFEEKISGSKRIPEKRIQRIKNEIYMELEQEFQAQEMPALFMMSGMDVVGLIQTDGPGGREACVRSLENVIRKLKSSYGKLEFSAGVGRNKKGVESMFASYREAGYAIKSARKLKKQERTVTCFENLGALCFLCELEQSEAAAEFYQEYMGELERYDMENDGALIETLEAYFQCGNNIRKTAEALYVHKNSVIYRLEKVEMLLNRRLTEDQVLFNLQLCLKLRQLK